MNQQSVLHSGLIISKKQSELIYQVLEKIVDSLPARFALLSDITGQVVGVVGDYEKMNILAISSLAVSDLAASQEIAYLTGETRENQVVIKEGEKTRMLMSGAGEKLVLLIQISNSIPLGWARLVMMKNTKILAELIESQNNQDQRAESAEQDTESNFNDDAFTDLFENALDDIWKE